MPLSRSAKDHALEELYTNSQFEYLKPLVDMFRYDDHVTTQLISLFSLHG